MISNATNSTSTKKPQTQRWFLMTFLFFIGWVFMYADRTILGPVQGDIRLEFGLNNAQVGLISSVFFLVYTIVQIPSGVMGDKVGRTRLICVGFVIFGIATGLMGIVQSFGMILLMRAIAGFGEGFYYGPQYAITAESIPLRYRTLGYAIINSGQALGITLGMIGSSFISYKLGLGWRTTFMIFAVPTILIGVLILVFVKDGNRSDRIHSSPKSDVGVMGLLLNPRLAATMFIAFCNVYGFFVMVTWLPDYLQEARNIPKTQTGMVASLVAWTSVPAALFFGQLSDKIKKRKPILLFLIPLAVLSIMILVMSKSWGMMIFALIFYGLVGKLATDPILLALISDNAPKNRLSTAYGLYNCIAMAAAVMAPYITGWLKDISHSFNSGFYLSIALIVLGWLVTVFFLHPLPVGSNENGDLADSHDANALPQSSQGDKA